VARRTGAVLGLAAIVVGRLLAGLAPFAAALGLVYFALLRHHDVNYYLAARPPEFWIAALLAGAIVVALAALLVRTVTRWALSLPLLLFEGLSPRRALAESAHRSTGHRGLIAAVLAAWAAVALALGAGTTTALQAAGRAAAPLFGATLGLLLLFVAALALAWALVSLAVGIVNISLGSLLVGRLYLSVGEPRQPLVPATEAPDRAALLRAIPRSVFVAAAAALTLGALGVALAVLLPARVDRPVLVIAHRGASIAAPENTLAAFRRAVEEGAHVVELDVQESADGEVVVVHDSDLMKVAGVGWKIWETDAARLRSVDLGAARGPAFAGERVPTLAEALDVCKGHVNVLVELKSYGHNDRLEERVVAIVETAGMEADCTFMSLDHDMVHALKRLRPSWRTGVLVAKALGDLTDLDADFLAVQAGMVDGRFVRRAHRAGRQVYVWTVDDPASMVAAVSYGVDGLITNEPAVARRVLLRRASLSDAQRALLALLIRLGADTEQVQSVDALRP
jgi:glycerophosphoryl diester phosphodiesterase